MEKSTNISTVINQLDLNVSKAEIKQIYSDLVKDEAERGFTDMKKLYIKLGIHAEGLKAALLECKESALNELEFQDNGKFQIGNCTLETMNSGDKLDYEKDPIFKQINQELHERQKLLKMSKRTKAIIVDEITGEEVPKVPVKTPGKITAKLTFK